MKGRIRRSLMVLILISLLAATSSAFGLPFSYTTTSGDSGPGAGITYTLDFGSSDGQNFNATFTISNSSNTSPEWYAGWFVFKFGGSTPVTISSLVASGGPWSLSDPDVKVLGGGGNYQKLEPGGGFSGFYVTSLAKDPFPADPTQGILLTGSSGPATLKFIFQLPDGDSVRTDSIPFKVGYYDPPGGDEKYIVNKLSEEMAVVPEPSTLLLLGSGLMGLGLWGRRRFKGRS